MPLGIFKRNASLIKSTQWLFFLRCMGLLQSILTVKIYFDYFDSNFFAFLIVLFSYQIIFSFFDLGVGNAIVNKAIGYLLKDNRKALGVLFSGSFAFLFVWTIVFNILIVAGVLFSPLGKIIFPGITDTVFVIRIFLLCSFLSTLRCCFALVNNYRLVYSQTYYNGIFDSAALILSIAGQLLAVKYNISFAWHVVIIFGVPILGHLANLILLCRQYTYLVTSFRRNVQRFFFTQLSSVLGEGMKFFFLQLASTFAYNSIPIILSFYSRTGEIAIYGILARLFNPVSSLITVFLQPQWSYLSESYLKKEYGKIRKSYLFSLVFVLTSCVFYFIVLYMAKGLISEHILDKETHFPGKVLFLFVIWIVLSNISGVYATILNALNAISFQVKFSVIVVILFMVEIILFVPQYGLTAVLLLVSVNVLLTSIVPSLIKTNRLLNGSKSVV